MTGLDKITSQIQEEAEASAKERIEAAQKEAEQILADAKAACEAMEKEASDKAAALKTVQDGRIHSAAEQKRKTALLKAKQEIIAEIIGSAYQTLKEEDTASYFLTMEKLAGILKAENFSMPAGYISEDGTQYLIKVGDEYSSMDAMKDTVLCKLDGIGDIRLKDVAKVTKIDDSSDSYGRVNGNDAILLNVSKASTAGTSTVSKECNAKMKELEKKYSGLRFTNLMDQGEYIDLIIHSVLSNLLWGALLAIIVLIIFLRDLRPTAVVAFSIPLSVLFAIVLMYFTNITLNVISLSGLALGVGMLVDNSIVVIENIYRLRNKGVSAARAAVMGANQVAGAIFSSTLTTVCVFLPIVFTEGLTRQLMMDMCLTIVYSLGASLIVALTLVRAWEQLY